MLLTLALVVFFGSILIFFSEEFIKSLKKLFALKGVKLFLPLFVASWIIYTFDFWILWVLFYLHGVLQGTLKLLMSIMPFQKGAETLSLIILLTFLSIVPVLIIDALTRRKHYTGYEYTYVTSGIIWLLCVVLLLIL